MTYTQLTEDVIVGLGRVGITAHGAFDDGQSQTPDVALNAVGTTTRVGAGLGHATAGDALGRHVALTSDVGLGDARHQISAHAEIADLHMPASVDEDVGGLDVAMDDVVVVFQGLKTHDRRQGHLTQDVLRHAVAVELVDGSAVHVLHADVDSPLLEEGAVEVDDEGRGASMQHVQLHDDRGELGFVQFEVNLLHGHDDSARLLRRCRRRRHRRRSRGRSRRPVHGHLLLTILGRVGGGRSHQRRLTTVSLQS